MEELKKIERKKKNHEIEIKCLEDNLRLESSSLASLKEHSSVLESEKNSYKNKISKYEREEKELKSKIIILKENFEENLHANEDETKKLIFLGNEEINFLENQEKMKNLLNIMKNEIKDFRFEINELNGIIEKTKRECSVMKSEKVVLEVENEREERKLLSIKEEINFKKTEFSQLVIDSDFLKNNLKIQKIEFEEMKKKSENEKLIFKNKENQNIEDENKKIKLDTENEMKLKFITDSIIKEKFELQYLDGELNNLKIQKKSLEESVKIIETDFISRKKEMDEIFNQLESIEKEGKEMKIETQIITKNKENKREKLLSIEKEIFNKNIFFIELQKEILEISKKYEKIQMNSKTEIDLLYREKMKLKKGIEKLKLVHSLEEKEKMMERSEDEEDRLENENKKRNVMKKNQLDVSTEENEEGKKESRETDKVKDIGKDRRKEKEKAQNSDINFMRGQKRELNDTIEKKGTEIRNMTEKERERLMIDDIHMTERRGKKGRKDEVILEHENDNNNSSNEKKEIEVKVEKEKEKRGKKDRKGKNGSFSSSGERMERNHITDMIQIAEIEKIEIDNKEEYLNIQKLYQMDENQSTNGKNDSDNIKIEIEKMRNFPTISTTAITTSSSLPLFDHVDNTLKSKIENLKTRSRAILNSIREN